MLLATPSRHGRCGEREAAQPGPRSAEGGEVVVVLVLDIDLVAAAALEGS